MSRSLSFVKERKVFFFHRGEKGQIIFMNSTSTANLSLNGIPTTNINKKTFKASNYQEIYYFFMIKQYFIHNIRLHSQKASLLP